MLKSPCTPRHPELASGSGSLWNRDDFTQYDSVIMKMGFVYILSNKNRTTLYIGVASSLERRTLQHKSGCGSVFSSRYHLTDLMYFEEIQGMQNAIDREKQLKNWHKAWKLNLIKAENPEFKDLAADWFTEEEVIAYRKEHS